MPATPTTRLTWTPDLGDAAPTHAEWMRVATVAETILATHLRRAFGEALTVTLRPPTGPRAWAPQPAPHPDYGLHGRCPLSGNWMALEASYDVPVPTPSRTYEARWHRHLGNVAPTTLRGILALAQRQALAEVAELRDLAVGVTLTREEFQTLQDCARVARLADVRAESTAQAAQAVLDRVRTVLDAARDEEPLRCSVCGSADLHVPEWTRARGGAPLYGTERPTDGVWCERCGAYD